MIRSHDSATLGRDPKNGFRRGFTVDPRQDADMATDLFLVRHGEVEAHWRGRLYGCLDVKLSDRGRDEARRAADYLRPERLAAVVGSGLGRTRYGAAWIAKGRPLEERHDARLREIDRGDWCGLTFDELEGQLAGGMGAWRADAWNMRPPQGENMADVATRVHAALDELAEQHAGEKVAVVVHAHVIRAALARALDRELVMQLDIPTGTVVALDWSPGTRAFLHWIHPFTGAAPIPADQVPSVLATP